MRSHGTVLLRLQLLRRVTACMLGANQRIAVFFADTTIIQSLARGGNAEGGAICCAVASFLMANSSLIGSSAPAYGLYGGRALGGAVFISRSGSPARFIECRLVGSRAFMESRFGVR